MSSHTTWLLQRVSMASSNVSTRDLELTASLVNPWVSCMYKMCVWYKSSLLYQSHGGHMGPLGYGSDAGSRSRNQNWMDGVWWDVKYMHISAHGSTGECARAFLEGSPLNVELIKLELNAFISGKHGFLHSFLEKTWRGGGGKHQQWHVGLNTVGFTYVLGLRLS